MSPIVCRLCGSESTHETTLEFVYAIPGDEDSVICRSCTVAASSAFARLARALLKWSSRVGS